MNKEAFKQRMQSLKSYREQNPGKGYWDFKSYEEGGEVPPTNKPTIIEPIPYKGKLYSDRYGRKYTEEQVYDYYNNGTDEIDRFTGGPLVRGLKPFNDDPTKLPKLAEINDKLSSATGTMYKDMDNNGEFYYGINPKRTKLGNYLTEHEWSHYTDMLKAGDLPSADAGNNMFYQMSKDIINGIDNRDWYFTQPTEQKAHMNQLREYMFNNGHISRRGQAVSPKMMKKVIEEVSNIDSMREVARASRQFNNINKYTRWFNAIPLLGLGAAAMYNNNQKE